MDFSNKRKLQKDISKALKSGRLHKAARNLLVTTIAAGSTLGGLALASNVNPSATSVIVEAKTTKKTAANSAKVNKAAAVYNSKGKKVGKSLKKGKALKVYGIKTIKGKKYYSLGHGRYVLVKNVTVATTVTLKKTSYFYNSKGKRVGKTAVNKGKKIKVYGTKKIKGKLYYNLGNGRYIAAANVVPPVTEPSSSAGSSSSSAPSSSAGSSSSSTPSSSASSSTGSTPSSGAGSSSGSDSSSGADSSSGSAPSSSSGSNTGSTSSSGAGSSSGSDSSSGADSSAGSTPSSGAGSSTGSDSSSSAGSSAGSTPSSSAGSSTGSDSSSSAGSNTGSDSSSSAGSNTGSDSSSSAGSNTGSDSSSSAGSSTGSAPSSSSGSSSSAGSDSSSGADSSTGSTPSSGADSSTGSDSSSDAGSSAGSTPSSGAGSSTGSDSSSGADSSSGSAPSSSSGSSAGSDSSSGVDSSTGSTPSSGADSNPDSAPSSEPTISDKVKAVVGAVRPGMAAIYHGLSSLSSKLNDPRYQDVKNDIKDILAKISALPANWTTTSEMLTDITPILNDVLDIAKKVEGSGIKTDFVTILHGLETVNNELDADQIQNLKDIYAALENIAPTSKVRQDIKELAQGLHPDLSNIYHDLESIKSEVPADKYQDIKNDIKDIISGIKEMPASFDWSKLNDPTHMGDEDVQGVLGSFKKAYNAAKDIASKLEHTGVKTNLVKLLTDTEHINTTLKANDSELLNDLRDLDSKLENYSGTDQTIINAKGLAILAHGDLANIYHAFDAITTTQIDVDAINSAINDALGQAEQLPSGDDLVTNIAMAHLLGQSSPEINAVKAIYGDLRTIASSLEGKGIKTQLVTALHGLEDLNQKVAQDPTQIQNLKNIYEDLQNGNFTWLNDLK
ncbi:SLAP domain-containing protein [Lactobacillus sp. ESL0680]|uniref:SLAP domain-containing protein n=1 Tax=Lactobacillus sp. ESL0680 TaxID=2983210 RepID=UPI0023F99056|nr:SLAP domain-containing protein [Lactobacillus sp. ESL0680]WEV38555.1 SLAP domain-containing protein [Lactobacillus sp. ESL0680]